MLLKNKTLFDVKTDVTEEVLMKMCLKQIMFIYVLKFFVFTPVNIIVSHRRNNDDEINVNKRFTLLSTHFGTCGSSDPLLFRMRKRSSSINPFSSLYNS